MAAIFVASSIINVHLFSLAAKYVAFQSGIIELYFLFFFLDFSCFIPFCFLPSFPVNNNFAIKLCGLLRSMINSFSRKK